MILRKARDLNIKDIIVIEDNTYVVESNRQIDEERELILIDDYHDRHIIFVNSSDLIEVKLKMITLPRKQHIEIV